MGLLWRWPYELSIDSAPRLFYTEVIQATKRSGPQKGYA